MAKSSVSSGSAAVRSRSAGARLGGGADSIESGVFSSSRIFSLDISFQFTTTFNLAQTGPAPSLHTHCARSGQRAFDGIGQLLTHVDAGKACLQRIVENLAHF